MSRTSQDQFDGQGVLLNGFDYDKQAWVRDGKYMRCGHPMAMQCGCWGREHEGEPVVKALRTPSQPCTASQMTFGGKCLNCGGAMNRTVHNIAKSQAASSFRLALELILDSGLSVPQTKLRLDALNQECKREYSRAKSERNFWYIDYWRGNRNRIGKAIQLVNQWREPVVRIPISTIYKKPTLEPINRLAAMQVPEKKS